ALVLSRERRFQQGNLIRREVKQAIHNSVDFALRRVDLGCHPLHFRGLLGKVFFPSSALLDRDIGKENAFDLGAEAREIEVPPVFELPRRLGMIRWRQIDQDSMRNSRANINQLLRCRSASLPQGCKTCTVRRSHLRNGTLRNVLLAQLKSPSPSAQRRSL